jgi:hypothetical protein
MLGGCQSKPVGVRPTPGGGYTVVQQDSVFGMNVGKPHYNDNGKRVDLDEGDASQMMAKPSKPDQY